MQFKEPKVILLAKTEVDYSGLNALLAHIGSTEWEPDTTNSAEVLTEVAGRLCYKSFDPKLNPNVTKVREGNKPYVKNILKQKHGSVLEHSTVTLAFLDVTRIFTHEIVRHRAGTAFSQESLRFVRLEDINAFYPEVSLKKFPWMKSYMERQIQIDEKIQKELAEKFLINDGNFVSKKTLTSAMRRMAPEGLCTNIIVTGNHRAWRHIITKRCNEHAEEEIRMVMTMVAKKLRFEFPNIYQDMFIKVAEDGGPIVGFDNEDV